MGITDSLGALKQQRIASGYYDQMKAADDQAKMDLINTAFGTLTTGLKLGASIWQSNNNDKDGKTKTQDGTVAGLQQKNEEIFKNYGVQDLKGLGELYNNGKTKYEECNNNLQEKQKALSDAQLKAETSKSKYEIAQNNIRLSTNIIEDDKKAIEEIDAEINDLNTNGGKTEEDPILGNEAMQSTAIDASKQIEELEKQKKFFEDDIKEQEKLIEDQHLEEKKTAMDTDAQAVTDAQSEVEAAQKAVTDFKVDGKYDLTQLQNDYQQAQTNQQQIEKLQGNVTGDTNALGNANTARTGLENAIKSGDASTIKGAAEKFLDAVEKGDNSTMSSIKNTDLYKFAQDVKNGTIKDDDIKNEAAKRKLGQGRQEMGALQ